VSLRAHIEQEKVSFYSKNSKAIEQIIQERVVEGVKRKLPIVVRTLSVDLALSC